MQTPSAEFYELAHAVDWCERWIRLKTECSTHRLAAIFDIDSTLVDKDGKRIEEVCGLFDACHNMRVTPFLVTARSEAGRSYTEAQMNELGITGFKRLYMHPVLPEGHRCDVVSAGREKNEAHNNIERHGYRICLNVGDAKHDHFHANTPVVMHQKAALSSNKIYTFVTCDGVAHLKLPG